MPPSTLTPEQRCWAKVRKTDLCWIWTAGRDPYGYGRFKFGRETLAHRASYIINVGSIPDGTQLDHLCRNRSCVNPDHLEPVTNQENALRSDRARRAKCRRGHLIEGRDRVGNRYCLVCQALSKRDSARRRRAAK